MGTKTFNNYEDLLTFTRASKGHALRPVSYGTELVTNGDFSNGLNGWTDNSQGSGTSEISVVNGQLNVTCVGSDTAWAYQIVTLKVGALYQISYDVIQTQGGNIHVYLGASAGGGDSYQKLASVGSHTDSFVADDATSYLNIREFTAGTSIIDNLSIKEVTFDQPDGTLTLFEHPNNIPRVEWDADRNRLGLLVEESRTNLIPYSEDFNSWGKVRSTVNTDVIQAPDGTTTGDALVATAVNDDHAVGQAVSVTAQPYTFTAFIKAGDKSFVRLWQTNDSILADFDLTNLTVGYTLGSPSATSIEDVGNGWRRCSITMTPTAGTRTFRIYAMEADNDKLYLGDGSTEDIYIWGAQVEAGSFPTSYIKSNSGSTTTRSADVVSIPTADFGFNTDAGTFVLDASWAGNSSDVSAIVHLGDASDRHLVYYNSGSYRYQVKSGNSVTAQITASGAEENDVIAASYKKDSFFFGDGSAINSDTSGNLPATVLTTLDIGGYSSDNHFNGHIKSIRYFPRQLTTAQLQALTEPRSTPTLSLTFDGLESSYTENYIHG